jgi:predicted O-methyltransferase YrrM
MSQELTPTRIAEMARAFMTSRIILTAWELGVFPTLRDGPLTAGEVAQRIGCSERGTDRLLAALVVLGLLEKEGDKYALTDVARRAFLPESPEFLGGLGHACQLWETWSTLTDAVRRGGEVLGTAMPQRDREYFEKFIAAMHANAAPRAAEIAALLPLRDPRRIIDVGGGSGAYAAAFAARFPQADVILFDLPQVVEIAPSFLQRTPGGDRVRLVAGDMLTDDLPGPADLIWMSAIIHMFSPDENRQLVGRCARALAPGGLLAIQDFVMDEARLNPPAGAIFALNMLVGRDSGDTYTEGEIRAWFEDAGLQFVERIDRPYNNAIMIARR